MLNIMTEVNSYLSNKIDLYSPIVIQNAFVGDETEQIMSRQDPSNAVESRYLDGTRTGDLRVSYYTKSTDQLKARQQLDEIIDALDVCDMAEITGGLLVTIQAVSLPSYVQLTDRSEHIFTATVKIMYNNVR